MWNSFIETAKYLNREIKQTTKLHSTSSLCCITLPTCFETTWGRSTARSDFMIYLFIFIFLPFYLFYPSSIFWRLMFPYISFFFSPVVPSLCYIPVLIFFFPSVLLYVLFFISYLLFLYCRIISCFFLTSRFNFIIHILVCNLPPEHQKSEA